MTTTSASRAILDPLRRTPGGQSGKFEADCVAPEPCPPQIDPGGKTALRVGVERGDARPAACPGNRKLRRQSRFADAALALCDRDHQSCHFPPPSRDLHCCGMG
jgi:hypothetical protein